MLRIQCQHMGLGKINNMNVIPHTGPVRSLIIIAVDVNFFPLTQSCLKDYRNNMCFRFMIFTEFFRGAASVKITQKNRLHAMQFMIPIQNFFKG